MFILEKQNTFVVPRTELTYPCHTMKLHQNAAKAPVDHVMADFEDACPYEFKGPKSRETMVEALNTIDFGQKVVTIRPNNIRSKFFLGDVQGQALIREHNAVVREELARHGGSEVQHTGDGFIATFPGADAAISCAVDVQRSLGDRPASGVAVRVGIHAGDILFEEGRLVGLDASGRERRSSWTISFPTGLPSSTRGPTTSRTGR